VTTPEQAARQPVRQAPAYRPNPRHDSVTRARLERDKQQSDMSSWSNLTALCESGKFVDFSGPAPVPRRGYDGLGRSIPRSRGLYDHEHGGELYNPAAAGMSVVPIGLEVSDVPMLSRHSASVRRSR
jgi:hypothetical protein